MFTLDQVVPWGRSFDEYRRMFALSDADLASRILGCGDGPAGFNADATRRGTRVVSADPVYRFTAAEIRSRVDASAVEIMAQLRGHVDDFVWDVFTRRWDALSWRNLFLLGFAHFFGLGCWFPSQGYRVPGVPIQGTVGQSDGGTHRKVRATSQSPSSPAQ